MTEPKLIIDQQIAWLELEVKAIKKALGNLITWSEQHR